MVLFIIIIMIKSGKQHSLPWCPPLFLSVSVSASINPGWSSRQVVSNARAELMYVCHYWLSNTSALIDRIKISRMGNYCFLNGNAIANSVKIILGIKISPALPQLVRIVYSRIYSISILTTILYYCKFETDPNSFALFVGLHLLDQVYVMIILVISQWL